MQILHFAKSYDKAYAIVTIKDLVQVVIRLSILQQRFHINGNTSNFTG